MPWIIEGHGGHGMPWRIRECEEGSIPWDASIDSRHITRRGAIAEVERRWRDRLHSLMRDAEAARAKLLENEGRMCDELAALRAER